LVRQSDVDELIDQIAGDADRIIELACAVRTAR